jgi:hypothetical protein
MTPEEYYRKAASRLELAKRAAADMQKSDEGHAEFKLSKAFDHHVRLAELYLRMAETGLAFRDDVAPGGTPQALYQGGTSERSYGFILGTTSNGQLNDKGEVSYSIDFPGKDLQFVKPAQEKAVARTFTDLDGRVGVDVRGTDTNRLIAEWVFG